MCGHLANASYAVLATSWDEGKGLLKMSQPRRGGAGFTLWSASEAPDPRRREGPLGPQAWGRVSSELFSSICFLLGASLPCSSQEGYREIFINKLLIIINHDEATDVAVF